MGETTAKREWRMGLCGEVWEVWEVWGDGEMGRWGDAYKGRFFRKGRVGTFIVLMQRASGGNHGKARVAHGSVCGTCFRTL
ncbi:MAG: hypothetical protein F6J99_29030 [Moorea sp. SIO4G3]|nr:hypothetical protein [Moorena sp. SIO4G3]